MGACTLTPTNGESDDPHQQEDRCSDPQKMDSKLRPKKNQDEQ
jgi:hypothetical protein